LQNPERKVYLPLMGRLGNQLFQVHAAASISDKIKIVLDGELFNSDPHKYGLNYQEIFRIDNEILSGTSFPFRWVSRRTSGLILRTNSHSQRRGEVKLVGKILRLLGTVFFSLRYGERIELLAPTSVGFEPLKPKSSKSVVLIGYFQSDRYVNGVGLGKLLTTRPCTEEEIPVATAMSASNKEFPLVVHVRLGDYSTNPQIGMLDEQYYLDNLKEVFEKTACTKIWLFSNEVDRALKFIPPEMRSITLVMESKKLNDSEILKLMSRGHAYFIANSTFSWWAARLSTAKASAIFAPAPWFATMSEPFELIPKEWNRIKSIFKCVD
jgi:hypothetical protein